MMTDNLGDATSDTITLLGSDDGTNFWQLSGKWADKANGDMEIDFSPKGGPAGLKGKFICDPDCKITWQDKNIWSKVDKVSDIQ